jgi:hypothetical protein
MISSFKLVANGASLICGVVWRRLSACLQIGTSSLGTGGQQGIPNHNQCGVPQAGHMDLSNLELGWLSPFSELSRGSSDPGDTLEYFFAHLALHFSFNSVDRGVADQRLRITTGHLHQDTWNRHCAPGGAHNIYCRIPKKGNHILEFWYVNANGHTYMDGTGENDVSKTRVNAFSDVEGAACSVEAFVERHRTLPP